MDHKASYSLGKDVLRGESEEELLGESFRLPSETLQLMAEQLFVQV